MERLARTPLQICGPAPRWVLLALLIIPGTPFSANAQSSAPANIVFTAPFRSFGIEDYPRCLAAGDVNGDLRPDLVVARDAHGTVSVLLATEEGNFTRPQDIDAGSARHGFRLVDLNADDHLDLAVTNSATGTVSILLGRGDGTFLPRVPYSVGSDPRSLAVGDLNRDGVPDIVTANQGAGTISVLIGAGDGTYAAKADFSSGTLPHLPSIVDLNRDGIVDLLLTNTSGFFEHTLVYFAGKGDGSFASSTLLQSTYSDIEAVAAADLNGDGAPDLTIATPTLYVLLMNDNGTIRSRVDLANDGFPFTSIAIGDLDRDGVPDVVAANPGGDYPAGPIPRTVALFRGLGAAAFGPRTEIFSARGTTSVSMADMNGDSRLDLVVASDVARSLSILPGNGDGTFGNDRIVETPGSSTAIDVGDLNHDGHLDLVTTNRDSNSASVLLGLGDGTFRPRADFSIGQNPELVAVADLNGDGKLDLALAATGYDFNPGEISIFLGNGEGGFRPVGVFEAGYRPLDIAIGDLNRDGNPDLAVANWGFISSVTVHFGRGGGTFSPASILETGPTSAFTSVAIEDVDNDEVPDLAFANQYEQTVSTLLGVGDGTFGVRTDITLAGNPSFVGVWDINHDGNRDLVIEGDSVYVVLGRGDGSFGPKRGFAGGTIPLAAASGDFNGDGHLDILSESGRSGVMSALMGRGDGTFESQVDFGARGLPYSIPVGDFDEDGRLDFAVTGSRGVSVMLNRTPGAGPRAARAFLRYSHRTIPIGVGEPRLCVEIEPVDRSFDLSAVDPITVTMSSDGTGSATSIASIPVKQLLVGDVDRNGVSDVEVCFEGGDLARLFSQVHGKQSVETLIGGTLMTGGRFRGPLTLTVVGTGRPLRAVVTPNPLNPTGVLTFSTMKAGPVRVTLFDIHGRRIRTLLNLPAAPSGAKQVQIGGSAMPREKLATGVYFYRIETADGATTGRFAVLK